jgi:PhzF family phenazine biosynthesis protein
MNELKMYQVDAFTNELFKGNPAAVCMVEDFPIDEVMQQIAAENNLAETAFVKCLDTNKYFIRWFTPAAEVDLCGHATLASAFILFSDYIPNCTEIKFETLYSGELKVTKKGDWYEMDFPMDQLEPLYLNEDISQIMGIRPESIYRGKNDYLLVYSSEKQVQLLKPNLLLLSGLEARGVIVTSKGDEVDFVSRFFAPKIGIDEDPVTGSAHTSLMPYWSKRLNNNELLARQISARGGLLRCKMKEDDRVIIAGQAKLFMKAVIYL